MSEKLYWAKTNSRAIIPTKRDEDAGWDMYCCFSEDYIQISPGETKMIGLGIASAFPEDYVMFLKERGSTAKYGLSIRAGVIDSGYRGEYVLAVTNVSNKVVLILKEGKTDPYLIYDLPNWPPEARLISGANIEEIADEYRMVYPYSKAICQGVLLDLPKTETETVTYNELQQMKSERGTGLMGSSGK